MYKKSAKGWTKHWDFIILDVLCLEIAFAVAICLRLGANSLFGSGIYGQMAIVVAVIDLAVAAVFNTFSGVLKHEKYKLLVDTVKHVGIVLLLNVFFTFTMKTTEDYSRIIIVTTAVFHLVLGYAVRVLFRKYSKAKAVGSRSVFIITTADRARDIVDSVNSDLSGAIKISGLAVVDDDLVGGSVGEAKIVANKDNVLDYIVREWVDEVLLYVPRENDLSKELYSALMEMGLTVHVHVGNLSVYKGQKQSIEKIGESMVVTTAINTISSWQLVLKRVMDIAGGIVGSIMALVIMAVVAIPLKKKSPGPLLYTAERIGQNGKRFRMYKIRSMYLDADARKEELMSQNRVKDGMMFKLDWDPRVIGNETLPDGSRKTGIGEFIRKTSLDEFPQFFNVLKGDMSLVGTRPPTVDEFMKYSYHHRARLSTKPGITGMWQVSGRSEITDFEEVVRLDTEYISNWNIGLDIKILFQTVIAVIKGKGAM